MVTILVVKKSIKPSSQLKNNKFKLGQQEYELRGSSYPNTYNCGKHGAGEYKGHSQFFVDTLLSFRYCQQEG